jgi:arylsulfatase A-like enzyme
MGLNQYEPGTAFSGVIGRTVEESSPARLGHSRCERLREPGVMPADAELSRHDPDVPEWDSLSSDARRLAARMMEVFAGFLSHTDHHIGRLIAFLDETAELAFAARAPDEQQ